MAVYNKKGMRIGDFPNRFTGKKISIIGDSIDTFDSTGYKIDGYNMYYPSNGVTNVDQTWWKYVIDYSGATLEVNASWSGSRVTDTHSDTNYPDFYDRVSVIGSPDIVFVTLGTNDSNNNVNLGEYDYNTSYINLSESTFRTAYIKGIKALKASYPNARVVCIVKKMNNSYKDSIFNIAKTLLCDYIDASDYDGAQGVHPGIDGMRQIASLILNATDNTFSQRHIAADAKAVDDKVNELKGIMRNLENDLISLEQSNNNANTALLDCFKHVAWVDQHGKSYYDALENALFALEDNYYNTKEWNTNNLLVVNNQLAGNYNGTMGFSDHSDTRRGFFARKGKKGILEYNTLEQTNYYPIPVPKNATKCTVTINEQNIYLSVKKWHYYPDTNSYSTSYFDSGWQTSPFILDLTPSNNEFITINIKNGSAGTASFTQDPTGSVIFDEGV